MPGISRFILIYRHENATTDVKTYAEKNTLNVPLATDTESGLQSLVGRRGVYIPHKSAIFEVRVLGGRIGTDDAQKNKINLQEETSYLNTYKLILSTFKFIH